MALHTIKDRDYHDNQSRYPPCPHRNINAFQLLYMRISTEFSKQHIAHRGANQGKQTANQDVTKVVNAKIHAAITRE